jgi:hypothetical protein
MWLGKAHYYLFSVVEHLGPAQNTSALQEHSLGTIVSDTGVLNLLKT